MKPVIKKGLESAAVAVVTTAVTAFVEWVKTRPLKTALARRRAAKRKTP